MMERIRRGWELTKKAWGVIRSNPKLVHLPIIGGLLALVFGLLFGAPGAYLMSRDDPTTVQSVVGIILVAIGAYLASFFIIYFNVALAAAADQALRGRRAGHSSGESGGPQPDRPDRWMGPRVGRRLGTPRAGP